jgi:hypothetical protein
MIKGVHKFARLGLDDDYPGGPPVALPFYKKWVCASPARNACPTEKRADSQIRPLYFSMPTDPH